MYLKKIKILVVRNRHFLFQVFLQQIFISANTSRTPVIENEKKRVNAYFYDLIAEVTGVAQVTHSYSRPLPALGLKSYFSRRA